MYVGGGRVSLERKSQQFPTCLHTLFMITSRMPETIEYSRDPASAIRLETRLGLHDMAGERSILCEGE